MQGLHRQSEGGLSNRQGKCFSNRNCYNHLEPYSSDFLKAKRKAFQRYKRIYPLQDKENLYGIAKTPCLGYYVMKGYRPPPEEEDQPSHPNSSQKIITNMLRKYLHRKEQATSTQFDLLPRLEQSAELAPGQLTSLNLKPRKNVRMFTEGEGKHHSQLRRRAPTE